MYLNKKGMTLVELIISVALLSVILTFLFKVLLDVKYESSDANYAITNQVNRAEIIKEIQNDIIDNGGAQKIYVYPSNVTFEFADDVFTILKINDNKTLQYDNRKWTMKDENYYFGEASMANISEGYVKITIPVLSYIDDDVLIDDIEIFTTCINCF